MTEAEQKMIDWIDQAPYEHLLVKLRFGSSEDKLFQGEVGNHYFKVIAEKRQAMSAKKYHKVCARIGWDAEALDEYLKRALEAFA